MDHKIWAMSSVTVKVGREEEALLSAASVRLRPILLTTFTTIAALLPTAIGTSVGSRIFQSFAITVIGGLLTAVLATLIVVPTIALRFSTLRSD